MIDYNSIYLVAAITMIFMILKMLTKKPELTNREKEIYISACKCHLADNYFPTLINNKEINITSHRYTDDGLVEINVELNQKVDYGLIEVPPKRVKFLFRVVDLDTGNYYIRHVKDKMISDYRINEESLC